MGRQLLAHRIEGVAASPPSDRRKGGFRRLELPLERDGFPVQGDHLTKACAGIILCSPAPKEPFVQTFRLGFEPVQQGTRTRVMTSGA